MSKPSLQGMNLTFVAKWRSRRSRIACCSTCSCRSRLCGQESVGDRVLLQGDCLIMQASCLRCQCCQRVPKVVEHTGAQTPHLQPEHLVMCRAELRVRLTAAAVVAAAAAGD